MKHHILWPALAALLVVGPFAARAQSPDPAPADTSRLFLGPTGRMLAPGQGYVTFDGIFMVTAQVGVTRTFSVGAGTPLMPLGGDTHPFWVTPKVQIFADDRTSVAAGLMNMFVPGEGQVGFAYTVGTIGSLQGSTTIGGGVMYAHDNDPRGALHLAPIVLIGGERRFKPRVSLLTENYLNLHGGMVSAGVRWRFQAWQINLAGMVSFADDFAFPGLLFSFAYKFGGQHH